MPFKNCTLPLLRTVRSTMGDTENDSVLSEEAMDILGEQPKKFADTFTAKLSNSIENEFDEEANTSTPLASADSEDNESESFISDSFKKLTISRRGSMNLKTGSASIHISHNGDVDITSIKADSVDEESPKQSNSNPPPLDKIDDSLLEDMIGIGDISLVDIGAYESDNGELSLIEEESSRSKLLDSSNNVAQSSNVSISSDFADFTTKSLNETGKSTAENLKRSLSIANLLFDSDTDHEILDEQDDLMPYSWSAAREQHAKSVTIAKEIEHNDKSESMQINPQENGNTAGNNNKISPSPQKSMEKESSGEEEEYMNGEEWAKSLPVPRDEVEKDKNVFDYIKDETEDSAELGENSLLFEAFENPSYTDLLGKSENIRSDDNGTNDEVRHSTPETKLNAFKQINRETEMNEDSFRNQVESIMVESPTTNGINNKFTPNKTRLKTPFLRRLQEKFANPRNPRRYPNAFGNIRSESKSESMQKDLFQNSEVGMNMHTVLEESLKQAEGRFSERKSPPAPKSMTDDHENSFENLLEESIERLGQESKKFSNAINDLGRDKEISNHKKHHQKQADSDMMNDSIFTLEKEAMFLQQTVNEFTKPLQSDSDDEKARMSAQEETVEDKSADLLQQIEQLVNQRTESVKKHYEKELKQLHELEQQILNTSVRNEDKSDTDTQLHLSSELTTGVLEEKDSQKSVHDTNSQLLRIPSKVEITRYVTPDGSQVGTTTFSVRNLSDQALKCMVSLHHLGVDDIDGKFNIEKRTKWMLKDVFISIAPHGSKKIDIGIKAFKNAEFFALLKVKVLFDSEIQKSSYNRINSRFHVFLRSQVKIMSEDSVFPMEIQKKRIKSRQTCVLQVPKGKKRVVFNCHNGKMITQKLPLRNIGSSAKLRVRINSLDGTDCFQLKSSTKIYLHKNSVTIIKIAFTPPVDTNLSLGKIKSRFASHVEITGDNIFYSFELIANVNMVAHPSPIRKLHAYNSHDFAEERENQSAKKTKQESQLIQNGEGVSVEEPPSAIYIMIDKPSLFFGGISVGSRLCRSFLIKNATNERLKLSLHVKPDSNSSEIFRLHAMNEVQCLNKQLQVVVEFAPLCTNQVYSAYIEIKMLRKGRTVRWKVPMRGYGGISDTYIDGVTKTFGSSRASKWAKEPDDLINFGTVNKATKLTVNIKNCGKVTAFVSASITCGWPEEKVGKNKANATFKLSPAALLVGPDESRLMAITCVPSAGLRTKDANTVIKYDEIVKATLTIKTGDEIWRQHGRDVLDFSSSHTENADIDGILQLNTTFPSTQPKEQKAMKMLPTVESLIAQPFFDISTFRDHLQVHIVKIWAKIRY